jgi:hypothetical protein
MPAQVGVYGDPCDGSAAHGFAASQAHAQLTRVGAAAARVGAAAAEKAGSVTADAAPVAKEAASVVEAGKSASKIGEKFKESYDVLSSTPNPPQMATPHPSPSTLGDFAIFASAAFVLIISFFKAGRAALALIGRRRVQ